MRPIGRPTNSRARSDQRNRFHSGEPSDSRPLHALTARALRRRALGTGGRDAWNPERSTVAQMEASRPTFAARMACSLARAVTTQPALKPTTTARFPTRDPEERLGSCDRFSHGQSLPRPRRAPHVCAGAGNSALRAEVPSKRAYRTPSVGGIGGDRNGA